MSFSASREGRCFFVADVNPFDLSALADCIGDSVQRVSWYSLHSFRARFHEYIQDEVRDFFLRHLLFPFSKSEMGDQSST
jgi:hypothetical protein